MDKRGAILMSEKERDAMVVLERVKRGEVTMAEATRQLGISYRQCWRRLRRYEEEGAAGLVHRLRGGSGNRSIAKWMRERVVELHARAVRRLWAGAVRGEAGGRTRDTP